MTHEFVKARHCLQFFRVQGPRGVRVHDAAYRFQAGQRTEDLGHIFAVKSQGHGLAHPHIIEGLGVDIKGHSPVDDGFGIAHRDRIAQLFLDGFHLGRRETAKFHISTPRAHRLGAG